MTTPSGPVTPPPLPALGEAGLSAGDVMTRDVVSLSTTTSLGDAVALLRSLGVRHLPVVTEGRAVGLVDDRLVAFALLAAGGLGDALQQPVSTVMTHYVPQVAAEDGLQHVARLLGASRCDAVLVVDAEGGLLGIVTAVDVLAAVASAAVRA